MLLGSVVIHGTLVIPGTDNRTRCPRETHGPMIFFPAEMCTIKYQMALGNPHIKYPLVNVYISMENHHAVNGKIHYKWQFSIAMLIHQRVAFDMWVLEIHRNPQSESHGSHDP